MGKFSEQKHPISAQRRLMLLKEGPVMRLTDAEREKDGRKKSKLPDSISEQDRAVYLFLT